MVLKVKVDCDFIGVASTPMVSFYTKFFNYDFGIMISPLTIHIMTMG